MSTAEISLRQAQQMVDNWINSTGVRYYSELTNMAVLTEEVGEVARLMSRIYGGQSFKESDPGKKIIRRAGRCIVGIIVYFQSNGRRFDRSPAKKF